MYREGVNGIYRMTRDLGHHHLTPSPDWRFSYPCWSNGPIPSLPSRRHGPTGLLSCSGHCPHERPTLGSTQSCLSCPDRLSNPCTVCVQVKVLWYLIRIAHIAHRSACITLMPSPCQSLPVRCADKEEKKICAKDGAAQCSTVRLEKEKKKKAPIPPTKGDANGRESRRWLTINFDVVYPQVCNRQPFFTSKVPKHSRGVPADMQS